ncbi:MAG: hypothetical protein RR954_06785 [Christensenellaceae bacterium]
MKIEQVAINAIDAAASGYDIYIATAKAVDSIQERAENREPKYKRDWVLAYIKSTIREVAENWQVWSELLIRFISSIKTIYNIVRAK